MRERRSIFTSESVTEGHPDKVADGIADAVLDAHLGQDKHSRVACEVLVATGLVVVAGQITSRGAVNHADVARERIRTVGYTGPEMGFRHDTCAVMVALDRQSEDISRGVTEGRGLFKEQGAGDQGMMFGYACRETRELMPMPIMFAHHLTRRLAQVRREGRLPFIRPDGKAQVSVLYVDGRPSGVDTVVVSTQHDAAVSRAKLREGVIEEVVKKVIPARMISRRTRYLVNPTGRFVVGGPQADTGLTGRKIMVDTYGGMGRHGGGAFSGKDPSKVDRSACYMARYAAKNVVAAGLAARCEIQVAYAIGYPEPVSVRVETFGTGVVADERIEAAVRKVFGFRPAEIIRALDLLRPIYEKTSCYGHFGRGKELGVFTWEKTDRVEALLAAV